MSTTGLHKNVDAAFHRLKPQRGLLFGGMIICALLAFEVFNFSTTEFALNDLLGELSFFGVLWSTILAIAFCGIDFAGIARLFTPEQGKNEPKEVWYLFGAWLLAATMNAMLTWWGVSIAILNNQTLGNAVIDQQMLLRAVPIFVAVLVWLIRVLIIGTFSLSGERLFTIDEKRSINGQRAANRSLPLPVPGKVSPPANATSPAPNTFRPAPKASSSIESGFGRPEPTYTPLHSSPANNNSTRQFSGDQGNSNRNRQ